ncbi:MAG: hypothetical protein L0Z62_39865 [Gemmataceae bacterium]|nr:hypothetical protein [Gemmataceae bacterium]
MVMVWTYAVYLIVSVTLTVWVGWTLYRNGRQFLVDALGGNEKLADSVNHLLLVGFYLVNIGFVSLALRYSGQLVDAREAIEHLSTKLGIVLLVLGGMHFFNLFVLSCWRRRALRQEPREVMPVPRRVVHAEHAPLGGLRTTAVPVDEHR